MGHGQITALFRPDAKGLPPIRLETVDLITDRGIAGDRKAKSGSLRQVLLMDQALIDSFQLPLGALDENVVLQGCDVESLERGTQVRIGDVLLEVTIPCPPCEKLESIREGLREAMRGQRGKFTRVLQGGTIRVGDSVTVDSKRIGT